MSDSILKLQILARAELALAKLRARQVATQIVVFVVAIVFGLLGLIMLNLAGYLALCSFVMPATAALIVALANAALAVSLAMAAGRAGASKNEEKLAQEIRTLAQAELNKDITLLKSDIQKVSDDFNRIRSALTSFSSGTANILVPLVNMLLSLFKRTG